MCTLLVFKTTAPEASRHPDPDRLPTFLLRIGADFAVRLISSFFRDIHGFSSLPLTRQRCRDGDDGSPTLLILRTQSGTIHIPQWIEFHGEDTSFSGNCDSQPLKRNHTMCGAELDASSLIDCARAQRPSGYTNPQDSACRTRHRMAR
ncbi:hypothetical protein BDV12DRAFT_136657 [Aspergillus spectabilis]